ncbi:MAG: NDP-sugar synthase, partial [Candidatus Aminicenantes bacterium]
MVLSPIPWEKRGEFGTVKLKCPKKFKGLISKSGKIINFREKDPNSPSNLNNASIYMIEMDLLKTLDPLRTKADQENPAPEPFYDFGKHVFPAMLGKIEYVTLPKDYVLWGIEYKGEWFDVGRKRDYIEVNKSFLEGKIQLEIPYERYPWGCLGTNTTIDFSEINIIPPVFIGNNCIIESGTTLGPNAVIGDDWTIEREVVIKNSVLWKPYSYFPDKVNEIPVIERKKNVRH